LLLQDRSATVAGMSKIILKPGKDRRLLAGHCWVYAGEIAKIADDATDGGEVQILDHRQRCLGRGLLNRRSQITVRRFTTVDEPLDAGFFRRRLEAAIRYRGETKTGRIVSSESDLLPGLIVDRYENHLVMQALTLGIDQRKTQIIGLLRELLQPAAIVERSDVPSRRLEGLEEWKGVVHGATDGVTTITVAGVQFEVNLLEDQKTGFFLDQAENYREVGALCAGKKVLDCFAYHGGFALAAAQAGAVSVESVEISPVALARAKHNATLNNLTGKVSWLCANAFDVLKKYDAGRHQYDVIILDPPTFTRTKDRLDDALRGYKEINLRALKMLPPGGKLATFTCSHHVTGELFMEAVLAAAADARKTIRLVKRLTQSPDHPIVPAIPETEYLKGLLLQVV
jgi:23S rRNA (cytosine1962-C5)-methyltransferase